MPKIRELVRSFVGPQAQFAHGYNPDEIVAHGAAWQGAVLTSSSDILPEARLLHVDEVIPFTLGWASYNRLNPDKPRFAKVLKKNEGVETRNTTRGWTVRNFQTGVRVVVYQGEHHFVQDNYYLGELDLRIRPALAGQEKVDITFYFDEDCLLNVEVEYKRTREVKKMTIRGLLD